VRKAFFICLGLWFLATTFSSAAAEEQPIWRINLETYPEMMTQNIVLRFYGDLLVINSEAGNCVLIFDRKSQQMVDDKETRRAVSLLLVNSCPRTRFRKRFPEVNLLECWKEMVLEQVGGIGLSNEEPMEYYLRLPGNERVLLFHGSHRNCWPGDPHFVGDDQILVNQCNGKSLVLNTRGTKLYSFTKLSEAYIALNDEGTRFAVFERSSSLLHEFEGTNRLKVSVFRSADGRKIFERKWHLGDRDGINDGRIALSNDGSLLAIARGGEVQIFRLPVTH
jgi:hypothetical protein